MPPPVHVEAVWANAEKWLRNGVSGCLQRPVPSQGGQGACLRRGRDSAVYSKHGVVGFIMLRRQRFGDGNMWISGLNTEFLI
jgi:hypothetical protein